MQHPWLAKTLASEPNYNLQMAMSIENLNLGQHNPQFFIPPTSQEAIDNIESVDIKRFGKREALLREEFGHAQKNTFDVNHYLGQDELYMSGTSELLTV